MQLSESDIKALAGGVWKGFSKGELDFAKKLCEQHGLNPLKNEIYVIPRGSGAKRRLMAQVSIDGYRIIAGRHPDYEGQTPVQWCGADGAWLDVWLDATAPPAAAKVGVYRKGAREPTVAVLTWNEYKDNAGQIAKKMKAHMLAKAAESLALRKAFPDAFSGLYTTEELSAEGKEPMPDYAVTALGTLAEAAGLDRGDIVTWAATQPASMAPAALHKMIVRLAETLQGSFASADAEATFISDAASEMNKAVEDKDVDALAEAVNRAVAYAGGAEAAQPVQADDGAEGA